MALASGCCHPHPPLSHQICRRRSVLVQPTRNNSLENEECPVLEKNCLPWTLSLPRRPPPTLCFTEGPRSPSPEKARMGCERGPQSPRRAWSLHILLLFMLLAMKDKEEGIWGTPSRATVVSLLRCLFKRCPFEARVNGSPSRDRTVLEDSRPSILISPTPTSRELDLCLRPVFLHILR